MRRAIFTIVSNNYLHFARTLLGSASAHQPDCDRLCVLVDTDASIAESFDAEFSLVRFEELGLPHPRRFAFRYSILELNTAVKPWAFAALFARGYDEVVYLDPDIRLYGPLRSVFERLAAGAEIVLTPHLLAPVTDLRRPTELDVRMAGTYNLGFCALARRPGTAAFVSWWQGKLVDRCRVDFEAGLFVDQSWIDLVPGLFDHVAILREPGYNVAYWNIAQRDLRQGDDGWTACGAPLVFFHFSGMNPLAPESLSKHQDRYTLATLGPAATLVREYAAAVRANDADTLASLRYGFGFFDDARIAIPDFLRDAYRADPALRDLFGDDPFAHASILTDVVPPRWPGARPVTRTMEALWRTRPALRRAFALDDDRAIESYWRWFLDEAPHLVDEQLFDAHARLHASLRDAPAPAAPAGPVPHGWFTNESNIADAGIWVMPDATLPFAVRGGDELVVEGHYDAWSIELQTGSPHATLRVALRITQRKAPREMFLLEIVLEASGPISARATLPVDAPAGTAELVFQCSGHFVPHAIGLGDDARQLSWRASSIRIGSQLLLDARRAPPIVPTYGLTHIEGVDLVGYLAAESGVGESVRAFARACRAVGIDYSVCDVGYQNMNRQDDASLDDARSGAGLFGINVLHVNADQTPATLAFLSPDQRAADVTIAYWHWEQPELPMRFLPNFEGLDEVWVPSGFVHDAVSSIAPIPVFKVPHAIDFEVPALRDRAAFGLSADAFCVLTMYDFDSSAYRKNPIAAVEAFRRACGSRGDATLVIKTINADRDPASCRDLQRAIAGLPNVVLIDRYLDRAAVHALEHACDCFVSLHRAEGFGLALAEMMFLGKPVVATGWSGNMEFMTPMNSFPIDYTLVPLAHAVGAYDAGPVWAEADVGQAAVVLARLADDTALRRSVGDRAAAHMREHFSPARIGAVYRRRLGLVTPWRRR